MYWVTLECWKIWQGLKAWKSLNICYVLSFFKNFAIDGSKKKVKNDFILCISALRESIEIYAWAPKPYHKFMAFKSFSELQHKPQLVDLTVEEGTRLKVLYGSQSGFHAVDLDSARLVDSLIGIKMLWFLLVYILLCISLHFVANLYSYKSLHDCIYR